MERWFVQTWTADTSALHLGTTNLACKRSRVGATDDCYDAFVPHERDQDEAEVCVLAIEVEGIALVSWTKDEQKEDILDNIPLAWPAANVEAGNAAVETVKVAWGTCGRPAVYHVRIARGNTQALYQRAWMKMLHV
jgi:hypothetical protein